MTFKHKFFFVICLTLVCLTLFTYTFVVINAQWRETPLVKLESSEIELKGTNFKAIAAAKSSAKAFYALEQATGNLVKQNTETKTSEKSNFNTQDIETFAVNSQGRIYVADSDSGVKTLDSKGRLSTLIDLPQVSSLSVLENNNLVVASPAKGKLLQVYNHEGTLLKSFGELKLFDRSNTLQNQFLNRGKTAVAPSGEIYFAHSSAPVPTVQKFSSDGRLILQYPIEGEAVSLQQKYQKDFLAAKESFCIGGVHIISSVAVDVATSNVFVGMNGSSKWNEISASSGVVYEYDPNGVKLREYALVFTPNDGAKEILTSIKDISVKFPSLYVLTTQGKIHRFDLSTGTNLAKDFKDVKSKSFLQRFLPASWIPASSTSTIQLPCPQAQTQTCGADCPERSPDQSVDCAAAIRARLASGDIIIGGSCSYDEDSCFGSANICNTQTGQRPNISITLECRPEPPPPPPGSGGTCNTSGLSIECSYAEQDYCACQQYAWYWNPNSCRCWAESPIVIDIQGNGFNLTSASAGISFDMRGDGTPDNLAWTAAGSDDAWLVLDRNGNGSIDNGIELFGNFTPQPAMPQGEPKNGFLALAVYDKTASGGNNDGNITNQDAVFSNLRLWQDVNHNGISETNELKTLPQLGVAKLELNYKVSKRADEHGNQFRYRAKVKDAQGAQVGRWAWDVFLSPAP